MTAQDKCLWEVIKIGDGKFLYRAYTLVLQTDAECYLYSRLLTSIITIQLYKRISVNIHN